MSHSPPLGAFSGHRASGICLLVMISSRLKAPNIYLSPSKFAKLQDTSELLPLLSANFRAILKSYAELMAYLIDGH